MTKAELRKEYKLRRSSLSAGNRTEYSMAIANKLLEMPIWQGMFYHLYLSIEEHKEVDTEFLLNILLGKDKNVVVSKSDFASVHMIHYLLLDTTLIKKNQWNIPEPVDGIEIDPKKIDVVFVPLLAYDTLGHRVGYGKGFYDRFLSACRADTLKIGLSFFEPEDKIEGVYESDVALDYCVTPEKIYDFRLNK